MRNINFRRLKESIIRAFFFANGVLVIAILFGIFIFLLYTSFPAFKEIDIKEFFTGKNWDPTSPVKEEYGILSMIASTFIVTLGALIIAVPLGIGVASYLSDVAHWKAREMVKPIIEILAGIPSVVYRVFRNRTIWTCYRKSLLA